VNEESDHERRAVALVLAAGAGARLGRDVPKAFAELGGRTLIERALETVGGCPGIAAAIVLVPPDWIADAGSLARRTEARPEVATIVAGGRTRQESVRRGLDAVPEWAQVVVCHDAARTFATPELFGRVLDALAEGAQGAVPVVPSPDTVKRLRDGVISETIPRAEVGLAQTPQAFVVEALRDAHARSLRHGLDATDDAMLLEAAGYRVIAVEGDPGNFKLTDEADFARAEARLRSHDPLRAGGDR
jgi:2-C-methyl-D-erythritol 4-phosphate cytidylyltransferase